ncbi:MAG: glycosyltransferase, partial [Candidatus Marsarchaeota archaeon]|nr:glycosyltransferase [Candidatus Marsarchaeota archaeon]
MINTEPLVSIVLTTLNGARYLGEAINSCLGQTYPNIELIIVDGGSTDGTLDIVASYGDRVRLINQKNNEGRLPGAINLGLDNTRGEYLTWMQADCVYAPQAIERMVDVLEAHPEVGQVYADYWQINEDGNHVCIHSTREQEQFLNVLGDPAGVCFLIRRSVRDQIGPHDVSTHPNHDY